MQIQTWHPPLRLRIQAKYYVKSGLTNVLKMPVKPKICIYFRFGLPTMKHIKREFILKAWVRVPGVDLVDGTESTIKLFHNMVMLIFFC